ncbi:MAG: peptide-methionine (S)-S-oxide reductase MsrA [Pyrinomonadaceae bacterium]
MPFFTKSLVALSIAAAVGCSVVSSSTKSADIKAVAPAAEVETAELTAKGQQTAVFAGGCFWGLEAVFEHVKGVTDVKSGYSGGAAKTADYDQVSEGDTGHAEAVKVTFDPAIVSYKDLLTVFFSVAHDPTELNRQGPDTGTQYRSAIFYSTDGQKALAAAYIDEMTKLKTLAKPIVTEVTPLVAFYNAEAYHQDYLVRHPDQPYIVINDKPKVEDLKKRFPALYVGT